MIKNIFLYHKNCDDGFGAAWAAWKKFGKKGKYVAVQHGDPYPEGLEGKNVYLLDFCYSPDIIKELLKKTAHLAIIDHHKSVKDSVKLVIDNLYKMNNSGSVLAWKYFHPEKKIPKLLLQIEDVDLWNWKLPYSHELSVSLRTYNFDFKLWNKLANAWESDKARKKYITEGVAILKDHNDRVKEAVADAELARFCGYKTLVSNSRMLVSEIGDALYKKFPPIAIVWSERSGKIIVSLRSNGKVDVSKLAKKFNGGGHNASAAFLLQLNQKLPWKIIKK